jgi:hypothetical protein
VRESKTEGIGILVSLKVGDRDDDDPTLDFNVTSLETLDPRFPTICGTTTTDTRCWLAWHDRLFVTSSSIIYHNNNNSNSNSNKMPGLESALAPFTLKGFYLITWGSAIGTNVWQSLVSRSPTIPLCLYDMLSITPQHIMSHTL